MPEHVPHSPTEPVHPDVRHEKTDANVFGLVLFFIGFVFFAVVAHAVVFAIYVGMKRDREQETKGTPLPAVARERPVFPKDLDKIPEPRLQVGDARDMETLLARDRALLEGKPAWADGKKTAVRIPIDDAIAVLSDPKDAAKYGLKVGPTKDAK